MRSAGSSTGDLVGCRLDDRYQVLRRLGEGGMGRVYVARQIVVGREVAVKVIHERRLHDPRVVRRFLEEARSSCAMHHPNLVTVHDFGRTSDGILYLVMELLDGAPLRQALDRGPLPPARAVAIAIQIAAGLQAAHRRAVVHRDLKPDNVMLCRTEGIGDLVKILDFGLAEMGERVALDEGGGSAAGGARAPAEVAGSPRYMSPEQARGGAVTPSSDLYALGVVLYEMLSGRVPFHGADAAEVLARQITDAPPPLGALCPAPLPEELEQLVHRCLEKDPANRPASASVLQGGMERILAFLGGEAGAGASMPAPARLPARAQMTITSDGESQIAAPNDWSGARWRPGEVVARRYRLARVVRKASMLVAEGVDLIAAGQPAATLRRIEVTDAGVRGAMELALERWSALLPHFRHPRVATLLDCSWDGEALVLVEERPPSIGLDEVLARTPRLDVPRAIAVARDLCEGLERLHELGIFHHRIRPGAVRLRDDGAAMLADIALSALRDAGLDALGSRDAGDDARAADLRYQAPELLRARSGAATFAADLYALGALLHRMVTGEEPWAELRGRELVQHKLRAPPPSRAPSVPPQLDRIIARLLRPLPYERYRSVATLRRDLERAAAGEPLETEAVAEPALLQLDAEGRLHGQSTPLERLLPRVEDAAAGRGALVVLRGAAGVGKTRLLEEVAAALERRGGLVLTTKARESDRSVPFCGARRLLSELGAALAVSSDEARAEQARILRRAAGDLGALLRPFAPFLDELFRDAVEPPPLDEEAARSRLLRTLCALLIAAAESARPLCLLLDDLQWLDEGTRLLVEYLSQAVARAPLLVVAATRPVEATDPLARSLAACAAERGEVLEIGALPAEAVTAFVVERTGEPPDLALLAAALLRLSGGNPVSLRALLQRAVVVGALVIDARDARFRVVASRLSELAPAGGDGDLLRHTAERIGALSAEAHVVLGAVAVWGQPFDLGTLERLLDPAMTVARTSLPASRHEVLVAALVEAERAGVLRVVEAEASDPVGARDFAHDTFRETALRLLSDDGRRALRRRAAEMVAASRGPEPESHRAQKVAEHLLGADPRGSDVEWLERAARASLAAHGGESVVRFGRAARERLSRGEATGERLLALDALIARGLVRARRLEEAAAAFTAVLAGAPSRELRIEVHQELAHVHRLRGELREAEATLDGALALLAVRLPRRRWLVLLALAWRVLTELLLRPSRGASPVAGATVDHTHRLIGRILLEKAEVLFFFDQPRAFQSVVAAVHHGRRSRDAMVYAESLAGCAAVTALGVGWLGVGERLARAAVRVADVARDPRAAAAVRVYALKVFLSREVSLAQGPLADETRALVAEVGDPWLEGLFETFRAERDFNLGDLPGYVGAGVRLGELIASGEQRRWFRSWSRGYGAISAVHSGQPELARRAACAALSDGTSRSDVLIHSLVLAVKVQADALCGRPDEALQGAAEFLRLAEEAALTRWYAASAYCSVAAGLCEVAVRSDDNAEAVRLLARVLRRGRPVVRPYARLALFLEVRRVQLALLQGHKANARRRLARLVRAARRQKDHNHGVAMVLRDAALLEGGSSTADGRKLLREALRHLDDADAGLPLKRELAQLLGEAPPPAPTHDALWLDLERAMSLDDADTSAR